jgi:DNA-3-methyladenine glycosylase
MLLKRCFYTRPDVVGIARELLGKHLCTQTGGVITGGMITETEAYAGVGDRASHAYGGRRTARTEVMYALGGTAYIYLCYGVHSLFNVVTNRNDIPEAVLIRAIWPVEGLEVMLKRLGKESWNPALTNGPGKVTRALGIHYSQTGTDLLVKPADPSAEGIWIEDRNLDMKTVRLEVTTRVGVDYAGEDARRPYRFILHMK